MPALVKIISGKTETCRAETNWGSLMASTATHCLTGCGVRNCCICDQWPNQRTYLTLGEGSLQFQIMCTAFSNSSLIFSFSFGLNGISNTKENNPFKNYMIQSSTVQRELHNLTSKSFSCSHKDITSKMPIIDLLNSYIARITIRIVENKIWMNYLRENTLNHMYL